MQSNSEGKRSRGLRSPAALGIFIYMYMFVFVGFFVCFGVNSPLFGAEYLLQVFPSALGNILCSVMNSLVMLVYSV